MNKKLILHMLGGVLIFEAISMLLPLILAIVYKENTILDFVITILIILAVGIAFRFVKPKTKTMYAKEGFVTVALSWILISLAGSLPYVISGAIPSYIDAFFETVSGFTTTGASILKEIESLPKSILFWRSFTNWIGGMGVLVFLLAILPMSGGNNVHLMRAESPGPTVSKFVPKIKSTAKILYAIYSAMTIIQIIVLLLTGMDVFEAVTISISTAGTGGFSPTNDSIASFTPFQQNIITIFMFLFGVNFSVYYLIIIGKLKDAFKFTEVKVYFYTFAVVSLIICINIMPQAQNLWTSLRYATFHVASVMTTTGFATTDFNLWPELSKTLLVLLMFGGACAGSTGGGMKISRIMILIKSIFKELKIAVHPKSVHKISIDGKLIEHETVRAVNVFTISYLAIFALSLIIVSLDNQTFTTSFTSIVTTINNIGPGLDAVGPTANFAFYSPLSKLVLIFDMLTGRLEIFPMLILFSPYTWRK